MRYAGRIVAVALLVVAGLVVGPARPGLAQEVDCREGPPGTPTSVPWALKRLQPQRAWPISRGEGVTVAVIDSGVEANHPQLQGQVVGGEDFVDSLPRPWDEDCSGHGTGVAGIIAAKPVEDIAFYGVAPGAKILSLRQGELVSAGQPGSGTVEGMVEAINYAVSHDADVINISVTTRDDDPALRQAVADAVDNDVVVVAAAGNENLEDPQQTEGAIFYPAAYEEDVLAVAAVGQGDVPAQVSHEGFYVDVAAPGEDVLSTYPTRGEGEGYAGQNGTSFAAPFVSGVAALVRSRYPDLSAQQVMERIVTTADPPVQGEQNVETGAGVVNPYEAVAGVLPTRPAASPPPEQAAMPDVPSPPDHTARNVALASAGTGALAVVLVLSLAIAMPRGRARRWRPGRWRPPPPDDGSDSDEGEATRPVLG